MNETAFKPGLLDFDRNLRKPALLAAGNYLPPKHLDRRWELLESSNQGNAPMCGGYAMAGWLEHYRWKYFGIREQVDAIGLYNRAKEHDEFPDQPGTTLEAVLQAAVDLKYLLSVENVRGIGSASDVKQALHRYGVVLAAFSVTTGWLQADAGGWIDGGGQIMGGHAVLLCGYSDFETPTYYSIQNSWGIGQGWRGFNRMTPEVFAEQFDYGLIWDIRGEPRSPIPDQEFTSDPLKP